MGMQTYFNKKDITKSVSMYPGVVRGYVTRDAMESKRKGLMALHANSVYQSPLIT